MTARNQRLGIVLRYYMNIGTNLGVLHRNVGRAIGALAARAKNCVASEHITSKPWGFSSDNAFLNIGVAVELDMQPGEVLEWIHRIEARLGSASHRNDDGSYADRIVDIDIMAIDDDNGQPVVITTPTLTVPHPHLDEREFFTIPYAQLRSRVKRNSSP